MLRAAPVCTQNERTMPRRYTGGATVMTDIRIVPTAAQYADGFSAVVDCVARERKYIGFVEGPPLESSRRFIQNILNGAGVQMLALTPSDSVVGWCDIIRNPHEGFRHVGRLGMGLLP